LFCTTMFILAPTRPPLFFFFFFFFFFFPFRLSSFTWLMTVDDMAGNCLRFVLPMFVAPRYHTASERDPVSSAGGRLAKLDGGVSISCAVHADKEILSVSSGTHSVTWTPGAPGSGPCLAGVASTERLHALDRDFELRVETKATAQQPSFMVESHTGGSHALMLTMVPHVSLPPAKCELIFLVDQSGSMDDDGRIAYARRALLRFINTLPSDSYFNIVGFGSRFQLLWPQSQPVSAASLAHARTHIEGLRADLGGTELLAPIRHVLNCPPLPEGGFARQLFVLTDGQVVDVDPKPTLSRS
jgi:hypothetical protein